MQARKDEDDEADISVVTLEKKTSLVPREWQRLSSRMMITIDIQLEPGHIEIPLRVYFNPAVSAHSLLPICTRREQARANAKTSSSPVNMEVAPTTSFDRPWSIARMISAILTYTERDLQGHP